MSKILEEIKNLKLTEVPFSYQYIIEKENESKSNMHNIDKIVSINAYKTNYYTLNNFYKPISKTLSNDQ